jgi:hypothetical protein
MISCNNLIMQCLTISMWINMAVLGIDILCQMKPHFIAEKGHVQNVFPLSCKEASKPSAILHTSHGYVLSVHALLPCIDAASVAF